MSSTAVIEGGAPEAALVAELQASRTRIVEAADAARRRLERDLHDGAQQRLVTASLTLQLALRRIGAEHEELGSLLARVAEDLEAGLAALRELANGIYPAVLGDRGLRAAVEALAQRSQVPVAVSGDLDRRAAPPVELALYFTVAEALTNVSKYADATAATVIVSQEGDQAEVIVCDDGKGGADPANGSGLRGLVDRLGAVGGHLHLDSTPGRGTTLRAIAPLDPHTPRSELECGCCEAGECRCSA
jgi:signal transduction histidine kinase